MKPGNYLIMGVCACGKSTIGKMLANSLGIAFYDADDFHPVANREKMKQGLALTEEDRLPWLAAIAAKILHAPPFVLACSALRQSYRDALQTACPELRIIFLHGSPALLRDRLLARENHFMPVSLLDSQLALLESPTDSLNLDVSQSPSQILASIQQHFTDHHHV